MNAAIHPMTASYLWVGGRPPQNSPLYWQRLWQGVKKKAPPLCPSMGRHTHVCRHAHTPTSHSNKFYTPTQQCARTTIHAHTDKYMEREQWRVSALSERMPFLTLLSKCPRVNTADQMTERQTERKRQRAKKETEMLNSRAGVERLFLNSNNHTFCLSICLTWPHTCTPSSLLSYAAGKWVSCHGNNREAKDLLLY